MNVIKQVGSSGQITLGKKYAGQMVQMIEDEKEKKIILLLGKFIPENKKWMHEEPHRSRIERAMKWAAKNPPRESKLENLK